jgi:hypothetical protein
MMMTRRYQFRLLSRKAKYQLTIISRVDDPLTSVGKEGLNDGYDHDYRLAWLYGPESGSSALSKMGTLASQATSSQGLIISQAANEIVGDLQPLAKVVDEEVRDVNPV